MGGTVMTSAYTGSYTGIAKGEKADAGKMTAALNLMEKVANKTDAVTASSTAAQYPSAAATRAAIATMSDRLEITDNKVTSAMWEANDNKNSDVKYPTCKAVDALNLPSVESTANKTGTISWSSTDTQYPSSSAVNAALSPKEDTANKAVSAAFRYDEDRADDDQRYPTCKAVSEAVKASYAETTTNRVSVISLLSTDDEYPTVKAVADAILWRIRMHYLFNGRYCMAHGN
ncbi:hypothetical protein NO2_1583 [Candidatus Termititenax persephonae]|uniref:Uncharacterized protein n=1 Tax=Candidatus Termititenax persephonae TaxID=2218525 RepID=A0A388TJG0_9BACT|nr:hypothetical protein NO2_1583 [Candidatus Termititenax persephonae]